MAFYYGGNIDGSLPWSMTPDRLENWYKSNIEEGSTDFAIECNKSMDKLVRLLEHIPDITVKEVRKAGSMQKGTFYKDGSDIDCIVILNDIPPLTELLSTGVKTGYHRREHLRPRRNKIHQALKSIQNVSFVVSCKKVSNLQLKVSVRQGARGELGIDILLSANNLDYDLEDETQIKQMLEAPYMSMRKMGPRNQRFIYQPCLTPLQTEFVKSQPANVKSLIRLLKFWKEEFLHKRYGEKLINSYTLELIAIEVYEEDMGSPASFDLGKGFKYVMSLLANDLDGFKWYWATYYSEETAEESVKRIQGVKSRRSKSKHFKETPILLDPSDPSDNVLARWMGGLDKVSKAAQDTLDTKLLRGI